MTPFAVSLALQIKKLTNDQLWRVLFGASARADTFCHRRLGMPGITTVDGAGAPAGSTTLPVSSTLGFDHFDEQGVTIGTNGQQETILIQPGGIRLDQYQGMSAAYPFPGTLELDQPLRYEHMTGEPVTGCYIEIRRIGSANSSDQFSEAITQEAHQPSTDTGPLSRVVFVQNYPIRQVINVQAAHSFSSKYSPLSLESVLIYPKEGYYLVGLGSSVYEGSFIKTTYTAGYSTINQDIKDATMYYAAHALMYLNVERAMGIRGRSLGKRRIDVAPLSAEGQSEFEQQAEGILTRGGYKKTI